jgi:hypothetical protein
MNPSRLIGPFAVAGLVLAAAFATVGSINAVDNPVVTDASLQSAEVKALFEVAPLSAKKRAKLVMADPALLQAQVDALFQVAPLTPSARARLAKAREEARLQAEVDALFDVAPRKAVPPKAAVLPVKP